MKIYSLFIKHEIRQLRREKSMFWTALFFFGLLCFGTYQGAQYAERSRQDQQTLRSLHDARLETLNASLSDAHRGAVDLTPYTIGGKAARRFMFKEPSTFAILSVGHSNIFESQYSISLRDPDFAFLSAQDNIENPLLTSLGNFDFAFVIVWLLPLLIILYMYNVVSNEAEIGTLRLILSNPISLKKFVAIKSLVRFAVFAIFLIISLLAAFLIFSPGVFSEPLILLYVLLLIMMYVAFWFLACILVNFFSQSSITNISALFVVFLIIVLIIPTLTGLIADYKNPVPSRMELVNVLRNTTSEIDNDGAKLLDAYYFDHPELAPQGTVRNMSQYVYKNTLKNKLLEAAVRPEVEAYYVQTGKQLDAMRGFTYASPATGLYYGLDALAGNGLSNYIDFQNQVDIARRAWRQLFELKIFKDELMTADEIANLPRPAYQNQQSSMAEGGKSLLSLGVSNVLLLFIIFWKGFKTLVSD